MTAKARFFGDGSGTLLPDFSDRLKRELRGYHPGPDTESDPTFGHPADTFVEHVLAEAWWAKAQMHWLKFDCTKPELRKEQTDLLRLLKKTRSNLQSLSPDFDRLLGIDADPLGCADKLGNLIKRVESAGRLIDKLPKAPKIAEKRHVVAVEMAVRILHVLKDHYGIAPAATAGNYLRMVDITQAESETSAYVSNAVKILKMVGDDIGLVRAETTWRDIICEATDASDFR